LTWISRGKGWKKRLVFIVNLLIALLVLDWRPVDFDTCCGRVLLQAEVTLATVFFFFHFQLLFDKIGKSSSAHEVKRIIMQYMWSNVGWSWTQNPTNIFPFFIESEYQFLSMSWSIFTQTSFILHDCDCFPVFVNSLVLFLFMQYIELRFTWMTISM
jgi:hypothetical protein